ncbi:hypothetical protein VTK26DRAFT_3494 [Humicola hyalothermophila]
MLVLNYIYTESLNQSYLKKYSLTIMEWVKDQYNEQYEIWVPWFEDLYLRYFTRDNKASYTARQYLAKTTLPTSSTTGTHLQDTGHDLAADQLGQDGAARLVGDLVSREGINRVERGGKGEDGGYVSGLIGLRQ